MTARAAMHPYYCPPDCRDCERLYEMREIQDALECSRPVYVWAAHEHRACGWCRRCLDAREAS